MLHAEMHMVQVALFAVRAAEDSLSDQMEQSEEHSNSFSVQLAQLFLHARHAVSRHTLPNQLRLLVMMSLPQLAAPIMRGLSCSEETAGLAQASPSPSKPAVVWWM